MSKPKINFSAYMQLEAKYKAQLKEAFQAGYDAGYGDKLMDYYKDVDFEVIEDATGSRMDQLFKKEFEVE